MSLADLLDPGQAGRNVAIQLVHIIDMRQNEIKQLSASILERRGTKGMFSRPGQPAANNTRRQPGRAEVALGFGWSATTPWPKHTTGCRYRYPTGSCDDGFQPFDISHQPNLMVQPLRQVRWLPLPDDICHIH